MKIRCIEVGPFQSNCFIVTDGDRGALVVDPGSDGLRLAALLHEMKADAGGILVTHGHMDHVSGLADLCATFPEADVFMHPADSAWAFGPGNAMPPYYGAPVKPATVLQPVEDGQELRVDGWHIRIIATPGHTPGGVCFYLPEEKVVFSGDTLFAGSVGRTDFPGGDARVLADSLKKLAQLPDDTVVHAGHGEETTIGEEKRSNFFLSRLPGMR